MIRKDKNIETFIIAGIILMAALARVAKFYYFPNSEILANISPVIAIGIFGAAFFKNKLSAIFVPIAAMIIADSFIGFHSGVIFVYASMLIAVFIGFKLLKNISSFKVIATSLIGSTVFFLVTNFAVWYQGFEGLYIYERTFEGLIACYAAGLPFFRNALVGDLLYTGVLFATAYFTFERSLKKNTVEI